METLQGILCQRVAGAHQCRHGTKAVGHVAGVFEALQGLARPHGVATQGGGQAQVGEGLVGQGTAATRGSVG